VPIVFAQFGSLAGNIRDGKLVPLAVASQRRSILFPDVPTTAEAGYPGVALHSWSGLFAAAGTPPAVIEQLHAAIGVALRSPAVRQRLTAQGQEADGAPGPVLAENLRRDAELRARLLHDAGLDFAGRPEPGAHPTLTHQEPHP
jgi:tripartite-type tricarboxylate transporter receptor subunit TctC